MEIRRTKRARRVSLAVCALAALGMSLAACGGSGGEDGGGMNVTVSDAPTDGVLKIGILTDIGQAPDPDVYYGGSGLALTTNMYEGLVRYANGDKPTIEPLLAESWKVSKDNRVYTFKLRKDVTFHDGTPFTSAAVRASFERRLAVGEGPAYMAQGVKSFTTPDDHTVVITLEEPNSAFLDELASPYGPKMVSPTGLSKNAGKNHAQTYLQTHSLGTGPYQLTVSKVDERYQMKAFDGYWGGSNPTFTTVDLTVYKDVSALQLAVNNGDVAAVVGAIPANAQGDYANKQKDLQVFNLPTFQVGVVYMNPNRAFMKTAAARHAFYQAIDWQRIIDQVLPETNVLATSAYSDGALPKGVAPPPKELGHPDPAALQKYVETLPANTKVTLGISTGGGDGQTIANIVAAQLQSYGLKATVTEYQSSQIWGDFQKDPAGKAPDIMINTRTWPDASNPYLYGHVFWGEDGGLNHLSCSTPKVDQLLDRALVTGKDEDYATAAAANNEAMCNPIWTFAGDFVVAQPWLGGIKEAHSVAEPSTLDYAQLTVQSEPE